MVFYLIVNFPNTGGKIIIYLGCGIFLNHTIITLIIIGIGWFAWRNIQSMGQTCHACGSTFLSSQVICPICGETIKNTKDILENIPASAATIDIKSEDINL